MANGSPVTMKGYNVPVLYYLSKEGIDPWNLLESALTKTNLRVGQVFAVNLLVLLLLSGKDL